MPGSHLFTLGINQKRFLSTSKIQVDLINLGSTKGRGSCKRIFNNCRNKSSSQNCSDLILPFKNYNQRFKNPVKPIINILNRKFLSYSEERAPSNGILNNNFGWDNQGVWFSGNANNKKASYPLFTNFTIPKNKMVKVTVDFINNEYGSDFGLCFYKDNTEPIWDWGNQYSRIACQYNYEEPVIYGLTSNKNSDTKVLLVGNTYTCNVIYNPLLPNSIVLNTLLNGDLINSINLENEYIDGDYRIGFCADQDSSGVRTYIKNLTINVNNGEIIYENSLQNNDMF